jgi:hypothetical protein
VNVSFIDYRKYFSEMRGTAYRGVKILSAPVKSRVDVKLSEDNLCDINELINKTNQLKHSSLALLAQQDNKSARLINHITYETKRSACFVSCNEFVSRYAGETEKNLSSLFARAESQAWLLFLYQADALFVNVDNANSEALIPGTDISSDTKQLPPYKAQSNYLLTKMAQYPSAVLLSLDSKACFEHLKYRVNYTIS